MRCAPSTSRQTRSKRAEAHGCTRRQLGRGGGAGRRGGGDDAARRQACPRRLSKARCIGTAPAERDPDRLLDDRRRHRPRGDREGRARRAMRWSTRRSRAASPRPKPAPSPSWSAAPRRPSSAPSRSSSQMGKAVIHAGGPGSGQAAKICNNMLLGASMIATCEAFVLAEKLGLDPQTFFDIASKASGQCWSMTSYCPVPGVGPETPADRDYEGGFAAALMLKDLRLAMEAAQSVDAYTPMGARAEELYTRFAELRRRRQGFLRHHQDDRRQLAGARRLVGAVAGSEHARGLNPKGRSVLEHPGDRASPAAEPPLARRRAERRLEPVDAAAHRRRRLERGEEAARRPRPASPRRAPSSRRRPAARPAGRACRPDPGPASRWRPCRRRS